MECCSDYERINSLICDISHNNNNVNNTSLCLYVAGHEFYVCEGYLSEDDYHSSCASHQQAEDKYIVIKLDNLRECIVRDFQLPNVSFDTERLVDEWVFLCTLLGNDFILPLPSLEVKEDAVEILVNLYKEHVAPTGVSYKYIFLH